MRERQVLQVGLLLQVKLLGRRDLWALWVKGHWSQFAAKGVSLLEACAELAKQCIHFSSFLRVAKELSSTSTRCPCPFRCAFARPSVRPSRSPPRFIHRIVWVASQSAHSAVPFCWRWVFILFLRQVCLVAAVWGALFSFVPVILLLQQCAVCVLCAGCGFFTLLEHQHRAFSPVFSRPLASWEGERMIERHLGRCVPVVRPYRAAISVRNLVPFVRLLLLYLPTPASTVHRPPVRPPLHSQLPLFSVPLWPARRPRQLLYMCPSAFLCPSALIRHAFRESFFHLSLFLNGRLYEWLVVWCTYGNFITWNG